ncbi:MAG: hypothetical protein RL210_1819 [Pseudomonadota bacterium]|jgi:hypothetical protein
MATKPNNSGVKKAPAAVAAKSPAVTKESSPPNSPVASVATPKAAKPATAAKPVAAKPAVTKPAAAAAEKPATKVEVAQPEAAKPAAAAGEAPAKAKKDGKKPKLVRDSFTLPETDYALFASMKARCLAKGVEVKKSELLRAALRQLSGLDDAMLVAVMAQIERIKTGRPAG